MQFEQICDQICCHTLANIKSSSISFIKPKRFHVPLIQKPLLSNKHKVRELVPRGYALFAPETGQSVRKRILDKRELHIKYSFTFINIKLTTENNEQLSLMKTSFYIPQMEYIPLMFMYINQWRMHSVEKFKHCLIS